MPRRQGPSEAATREGLPRPGATGDAPLPAVFAGYRIEAEIHRGGQGVVYRAIEEATGEPVALKVLKEGPFASSGQRLRFEREIEVARGLRHPGIVALREGGISEGRPYFAMDYIVGLPLHEHVRRHDPGLRERVAIVARVCQAMVHAHEKGVWHRDLKPSNIIIDESGAPHVVDFGLAKREADGSSNGLTATGEFLGTLAYAAPEQAAGRAGDGDARTDVHALGVILYELVSGRLPYPTDGPVGDVLRHIRETEPKSPSTWAPEVDAQLSTIVLRALAKEPERRYPAVTALQRDLESWLEGGDIEARADSAMYVVTRAVRRYRIALAISGAFALVLLAFSLVAAWQAVRFRQQRDRALEAETLALGLSRRAQQESLRARLGEHAARMTAASAALTAGRTVEARELIESSPREWRGWEWSHLRLATAGGVVLRPAGGSPVVALALDARGVLLAAAGDEVLSWSIEATPAHGPARAAPASSLSDASAVREIFALAQDGSLALRWDAASWARLGAAGREVQLVDPAGWPSASLRGHAYWPSLAAFTADGWHVATATTDPVDRSPRIWSARTGAERARLALPPRVVATALAWLESPPRVAVACSDGRLRVFSDDGASVVESPWTAPVTALAVAGPLLAASTSDGRILTVDGNDASVQSERLLGRSLTTVASAGGHALAGRSDGSLAALAPGGDITVMAAHAAAVTAVLVRGDAWASGSADGEVRLVSPEDSAAAHRAMQGAACVAIARDGSLVAAGTRAGEVVLARTSSLGDAVVLRHRDDEGAISAVEISDDGRWLASAGSSGAIPRSVRVHDIGTATWRTLGALPAVSHLKWANGRLVALSRSGVLRAWDVDAVTELPAIECEPGAVSLAVSADGTQATVIFEDAATTFDLLTGGVVTATTTASPLAEDALRGVLAGSRDHGRLADGSRLLVLRDNALESWIVEPLARAVALPVGPEARDLAVADNGTVAIATDAGLTLLFSR